MSSSYKISLAPAALHALGYEREGHVTGQRDRDRKTDRALRVLDSMRRVCQPQRERQEMAPLSVSLLLSLPFCVSVSVCVGVSVCLCLRARRY